MRHNGHPLVTGQTTRLGAGGSVSRRIFLRNTALLSGGLALSGLGLSACSDSTSGTSTDGSFRGRLATSNLASLAANAPLFIAAQLGYFKDADLDIDFVPFAGGSEVVQGIVASTGFGVASPISAMTAYSQGMTKLKIIGGLCSASEVVFLADADSGVSSIEDLAGKKLGASSPGAVTEYMANLLITEAGLKPKTDVEIVFVGSSADSWTAASQGVVDVSWSTPPLSTQLVADGKAKVIVDTKTVVSQWVDVMLVATDDFIEKNRDAVQKFVSAVGKGCKDVQSAAQTGIDAYAKGADLDPALAKQVLSDVGLNAFTIDFDDESIAAVVAAGQQLGSISDSFDPNDIITREFVDGAS